MEVLAVDVAAHTNGVGVLDAHHLALRQWQLGVVAEHQYTRIGRPRLTRLRVTRRLKA